MEELLARLVPSRIERGFGYLEACRSHPLQAFQTFPSLLATLST